MHLPINHRLSGFYRFLAALAGIFLIVFGIVGLAQTLGDPLFDRADVAALGLRTNLAFSLLSIVVGAIVPLGAFIGGNLAHYLNLFGGGVFWLSGLVMLVLLQTDANIFNFQVATCIVSFLIGTLLVLAGLYGKSGTAEEEQAEDAFRHSGRAAAATLTTPAHHLSAHPDVRHSDVKHPQEDAAS
ncbi:MAG TPA: DUF4383 domain-containing protein [Candidatus Limnocylindrales bacterium]|nr:DUF4383 domain-containing protein [Candidatus Limnocylindrales bacterium]